MEDKKPIRTLAAMMAALMLSACSSMDAPHDPQFPRQTLMDQTPNNEQGALSVCAGHIDPAKRQPHQSGRC
jgi:cytochrome c556